MSNTFSVDAVDHVELFVSDWEASRAWYEEVLGLIVDPAFEQWWRNRQGPLMLSVGDTATKLALFEKTEATRDASVSPNRVAFQTDADGFVSFVDQLEAVDVNDQSGESVTADDVVDHDLSYSIYFTDLDGNRLELTTNEYSAVSSTLA